MPHLPVGQELPAKPAHQATGGEVWRHEAGSIAHEHASSPTATAGGTLHGGGPFGGGPVSCEIETGPLGGLLRPEVIQSWRYGEGRARLFQHAALQELCLFRGWEEDLELLESGGENLFPAHLKLGPRGTDHQLKIAATLSRPASNA